MAKSISLRSNLFLMKRDARDWDLVWLDCDRYRASLFFDSSRYSKQESTLLHPDVSPVLANWSAVGSNHGPVDF